MSEIPCRVRELAPFLREKEMKKPAHIEEALLLMQIAKGNLEGSLSDPVTTDPKGEAHECAKRWSLISTLLQFENVEGRYLWKLLEKTHYIHGLLVG